MKILIILSLLLINSMVFALELRVNEAEYNESSVIQNYFKDVISLLPMQMKKDLPQVIEIKFKDLNKKQEGLKGLVKKKLLQRKKKIASIALDLSIIAMIQNPDQLVSSQHGTQYRLSLGILLHEIMHIYDYQNLYLHSEKEMAKSCQSDRDQGLLSRKERKTCRRLRNKKFTISDSRLFSNLAGWNSLGLFKKKNKQHNRNLIRTPDRYELENAQEFLGVNFEFFILDPQYKCRRPNLYNYLAKSLRISPHQAYDCTTSTKVLMSGEALKGKEASIIDLDPKKVYQVHYLFAGKGKAVMSRWGHAMMRIVLCAPERTVVDENCLKDVAYHLVLSFRANITGTSMSYAKGISGSYDSLMFLMPLKDVVKEYTQGEFRDIFSVPLILDDENKEQIMMTILSQYWAYRGAYYFTTNNCANETLKMIRLGFKDDLHVQAMTVITPNQIYNRLGSMGLADMDVVQDKATAVKKGYLFEAAHKKLEKGYERLLDSGASINFEDYEDFLKNSTASQRRAILAYIKNMPKSIEKRKRIASLFKIENFLFQRKQLELVNLLASYINEQKRNNSLDPKISSYLDEYQKIQQSLLPENLIQQGYGIPLKTELNSKFSNLTSGVKEEINAVGDTLIEWAQESHASYLEEIKMIQENKIESLQALQDLLK